jgi:hypothetical protein
MNKNISSIVVVTSNETLQKFYSEFLLFFQNLQELEKKDLIIFSPQPMMDYSPIKKIPADEVIVIHQKDFFSFNLLLKPSASNTLKNRTYKIVVHFNPLQNLRNTYLISSVIHSKIKISDNFNHKKNSTIIFPNSKNFLGVISNYLEKLVI